MEGRRLGRPSPCRGTPHVLVTRTPLASGKADSQGTQPRSGLVRLTNNSLQDLGRNKVVTNTGSGSIAGPWQPEHRQEQSKTKKVMQYTTLVVSSDSPCACFSSAEGTATEVFQDSCPKTPRSVQLPCEWTRLSRGSARKHSSTRHERERSVRHAPRDIFRACRSCDPGGEDVIRPLGIELNGCCPPAQRGPGIAVQRGFDQNAAFFRQNTISNVTRTTHASPGCRET